jgi:hypothetical protein
MWFTGFQLHSKNILRVCLLFACWVTLLQTHLIFKQLVCSWSQTFVTQPQVVRLSVVVKTHAYCSVEVVLKQPCLHSSPSVFFCCLVNLPFPVCSEVGAELRKLLSPWSRSVRKRCNCQAALSVPPWCQTLSGRQGSQACGKNRPLSGMASGPGLAWAPSEAGGDFPEWNAAFPQPCPRVLPPAAGSSHLDLNVAHKLLAVSLFGPPTCHLRKELMCFRFGITFLSAAHLTMPCYG